MDIEIGEKLGLCNMFTFFGVRMDLLIRVVLRIYVKDLGGIVMGVCRLRKGSFRLNLFFIALLKKS
jgi:hypothetical protein